MNIVVAVDLAPGVSGVIAAAERRAQASAGAVYVLHVAEPDPDFVGYGAGPQVVRDQVAELHHREHRAVQALAERLRAVGIDTTALLIRGPTVETTLNEAKRLNAELIIVGSHGRGALYDVLVCSYSAGILRRSTVPVLAGSGRASGGERG